MSQRHFTPAVFRFLRDLARNNDRDWFQANRERYLDEARDPALRFITDFGAHLARISPHFRADPRPSGGSLFRIYRDIRFSRDKSPYKTHLGIHFRHEAGKSAHAPGFYLHLEPRACFMGVGIWRPDTATLVRLRRLVADDPDAWRAMTTDPRFATKFSITGERLKRPPRGFPADHPLVEVLKLKDFTALTPLTQRSITSAGFVEDFAELCQAGMGLNRFICRALDLPA